MNRYEMEGMSALLPGLQHMLDIMHNEVDRMLELSLPESGVRPRVSSTSAVERTMSQDHRNKISLAASRNWQKMSAKQKRARLDAMKRGRTHAPKT